MGRQEAPQNCIKIRTVVTPWPKLTLAATGSHLCKRAVTTVALSANHTRPAIALARFLITGTRGGANGVAVTGKADVAPFRAVMEFLWEEGKGAGEVVRRLGHRKRGDVEDGQTRVQARESIPKEPTEAAGGWGRDLVEEREGHS